MEGMAHPCHGLGRTATDCNHLEMLGFEFPILYFSFFLESLEVSGYVPVEVHKYLFFPGGRPPKKGGGCCHAMWGARKGTPHHRSHQFLLFCSNPIHSPPLLQMRHHPKTKKKGASTLDDHNNAANPCVSYSKIQRCHRLSKPLSAAVPRTGECTSRIRRRLPELSYPASRVDCGLVEAPWSHLPRSSRQVSRHPPTGPAARRAKSTAATGRPRRPPPIGRAPGLDKRVEGGGCRIPWPGEQSSRFVPSFPPVPANLEPRQTVEPLETDVVSMGRDELTPLGAWFLRNLPRVRRCGLKKGGVWSVASILVDPRSHMRNVGIASHPPDAVTSPCCRGKAPVQTDGGHVRGTVDEALEAVDAPGCPHSPHCVAAGSRP